jgi:hypothetical protein
MIPGHQQFADVYTEHVWRVYGYIATASLIAQPRRISRRRCSSARCVRGLVFTRSAGPSGTWLLSIAGNLLIDHSRRQRFRVWEPLKNYPEPAVEGPEADLRSLSSSVRR